MAPFQCPPEWRSPMPHMHPLFSKALYSPIQAADGSQAINCIRNSARVPPALGFSRLLKRQSAPTPLMARRPSSTFPYSATPLGAATGMVFVGYDIFIFGRITEGYEAPDPVNVIHLNWLSGDFSQWLSDDRLNLLVCSAPTGGRGGEVGGREHNLCRDTAICSCLWVRQCYGQCFVVLIQSLPTAAPIWFSSPAGSQQENTRIVLFPRSITTAPTARPVFGLSATEVASVFVALPVGGRGREG